MHRLATASPSCGGQDAYATADCARSGRHKISFRPGRASLILTRRKNFSSLCARPFRVHRRLCFSSELFGPKRNGPTAETAGIPVLKSFHSPRLPVKIDLTFSSTQRRGFVHHKEKTRAKLRVGSGALAAGLSGTPAMRRPAPAPFFSARSFGGVCVLAWYL